MRWGRGWEGPAHIDGVFVDVKWGRNRGARSPMVLQPWCCNLLAPPRHPQAGDRGCAQPGGAALGEAQCGWPHACGVHNTRGGRDVGATCDAPALPLLTEDYLLRTGMRGQCALPAQRGQRWWGVARALCAGPACRHRLGRGGGCTACRRVHAEGTRARARRHTFKWLALHPCWGAWAGRGRHWLRTSGAAALGG